MTGRRRVSSVEILKNAKHRFHPVDEAAASHRDEIQKLLKPQKEKLAHFVETKRKCEDIAAHVRETDSKGV